MKALQPTRAPRRTNGKLARRALLAEAPRPLPNGPLELALAVHAPTADEIATRAYYLWEKSGRTSDAEQNWYEAERQLWDEYWNGAPAPLPVTSA